MSLAGIFTAVCLKLHIRFCFLETNQQIVKGLTHCLLPECSNPTWPFQNYCGRTHANIGIQRGLIRMSVSCVYPHSPSSTSPCERKNESIFIHCFALSLSQPPCPQWTPVPPSNPRTVPCVSSQTALVPSMWRVPLPTPTVAGHTQSRADSWALSVSHSKRTFCTIYVVVIKHCFHIIVWHIKVLRFNGYSLTDQWASLLQ